MKTSLEHLPEVKQREIFEIVEIIKDAVNSEKIILFGSYATGKWVEDKYMSEGIFYEYLSDYDFLIVTKEDYEKEIKNSNAYRQRISIILVDKRGFLVKPFIFPNTTIQQKRPLSRAAYLISFVPSEIPWGHGIFETINKFAFISNSNSTKICGEFQLKLALNSSGLWLVFVLNNLLNDCGCSKPNS